MLRASQSGSMLLAREAGEPVAALTGRVQGDRGWVGSLGVRAPWRGRGIGAALLRRSFAAFSRRGLRRVVLGVDAENATGPRRSTSERACSNAR